MDADTNCNSRPAVPVRFVRAGILAAALAILLPGGDDAPIAAAAPPKALDRSASPAAREDLRWDVDSMPDRTAEPPTAGVSAPRLMLLAGYSLLIILASLAGGMLPTLVHLTHIRMQFLISVVGGLMLGIAVFHLAPHAAAALGPAQLDRFAYWLMAGLLITFFLLRAFHFHHHEGAPSETQAAHHEPCRPAEHCADPEHAAHSHHHPAAAAHRLSWVGVFVGLSLHTLIDGAALGASVEAEGAGSHAWGLYGLGTFAAVVLHKPLDALSITSLMRSAGWSSFAIHAVNTAFAAMCPLGAALLVLGLTAADAAAGDVLGCALAFAAGVFLCIALSDLLPEMELHSHHRLHLSAALLLGVIVAWGIGYLEPAHLHPHAGGQAKAADQ